MTYRWAMFSAILFMVGLFSLFWYIASTEPVEDLGYPTFILPEVFSPPKK